MTDRELKVRQKKEVAHKGEPTKDVRQFVPAVDIFETAEKVTVLADMPGVPRENVKINLEDGILTLYGAVPEVEEAGRRVLLREFEPGHYVRRFTISEAIDQERISASMTNGVLRLELPKLAPARPRKIEVRSE